MASFGLGKFSGNGFHPHYVKCQSGALWEALSCLRDEAQEPDSTTESGECISQWETELKESERPGSPHLHRVLCDLCGRVVVGRGITKCRKGFLLIFLVCWMSAGASDATSTGKKGGQKEKGQEWEPQVAWRKSCNRLKGGPNKQLACISVGIRA